MNQAIGLDAFNFTLAGEREGFGPFLGVYLQHQGFDPARTGFAMSLAGLAGIAATAPLGALIDRITAKRAAVVIAVVAATIRTNERPAAVIATTAPTRVTIPTAISGRSRASSSTKEAAPPNASRSTRKSQISRSMMSPRRRSPALKRYPLAAPR